jgi:anti-anti-sigma regulatory factor
MDISIDTSAEHPRIRITGQATVEHMARLREQLLPLLRRGRTLLLDLSSVEKADVTFLQLLLSLSNSAHSLDMQIAVMEDGISPALTEIAMKAGFIWGDAERPQDELWTLLHSGTN